MKLNSSNSPVYLPEKTQHSVLRLGLEHCRKEDWIYSSEGLAIFYQHKVCTEESLKDKCYNALPGSEAAQEEFHDFLLQHLLANKKLGYRLSGSRLLHDQSKLNWELGEEELWQSSLWIAEDICLLESKANTYVLTAASVCSPSNWNLEEKIGESVANIHTAVPGYSDVLEDRVNRFLRGLSVNKPMTRYNWSIQTGNELLWLDDLRVIDLQKNEGSSNLYWRIERQTFIRLPSSGAIVFAIRIFLHSFDSLRRSEQFEPSVSRLLSQLPDSEKLYKGLS